MVLAAAAALDPDYPMPRAVLQSIVGTRASSDGLTLLEPLGNVPSTPAVFRWSTVADAGDEVRSWHLLVFAADFSEVARVQVTGCEVRVEGRLRDAIEGVSEFHWRVETSAHNGLLRSAPAAVAISR